jgi:N-acetylglutamate synthase-like GNAT family acetyltransferase|uniref:N-acetyltransferase domain-containing protein n=1 Tax=viral metagenome TaxID=1070528 RepID=A0A6C0IYA8_9ZZZZ
MNIINLKDSIIYFNEQNIIEYLTLLNSLTTVYSNDQELQNMVTNFRTTVSELPSNTMIYVIMNDKQVIGSGTLLIEQKIIHNYGKVGHIEDIVIDNNMRGQGLGKKIINYLISQAKIYNCYKVILGCDDSKVDFYKKCKPDNSKIKVINQISYYLDTI